MGITVLKNNVPWGPFTRAQVDEGLERGDFTLKYLAHAPGLKEWLPLGEVLHFLDLGKTLPPVPASQALPPVPGQVAALPKLNESLPQQAPPPMAARPILHQPVPLLAKAPFIPRCMAFAIDCAILFLPIVLVFALGVMSIELRGWWESTDAETMRQEWALADRNFHELLLLVAIGLGWLYAAGFESSSAQATIGKRWMGMKVTDLYGERVGFLRASGRHAGKYLSALPCFLGFMVALFSSRGQALHDRLAGTRVLRD